MTRVKIVMTPGALRKIRYLPSTARMLEVHGRRVESQANSSLGASTDEQQGFRMSSQPGARRPYGRHRVSVAAVTPHAKRHDRKHNTLIRALGSG
jgi:hypothetical protein